MSNNMQINNKEMVSSTSLKKKKPGMKRMTQEDLQLAAEHDTRERIKREAKLRKADQEYERNNKHFSGIIRDTPGIASMATKASGVAKRSQLSETTPTSEEPKVAVDKFQLNLDVLEAHHKMMSPTASMETKESSSLESKNKNPRLGTVNVTQNVSTVMTQELARLQEQVAQLEAAAEVARLKKHVAQLKKKEEEDADVDVKKKKKRKDDKKEKKRAKKAKQESEEKALQPKETEGKDLQQIEMKKKSKAAKRAKKDVERALLAKENDSDLAAMDETKQHNQLAGETTKAGFGEIIVDEEELEDNSNLEAVMDETSQKNQLAEEATNEEGLEKGDDMEAVIDKTSEEATIGEVDEDVGDGNGNSTFHSELDQHGNDSDFEDMSLGNNGKQHEVSSQDNIKSHFKASFDDDIPESCNDISLLNSVFRALSVQLTAPIHYFHGLYSSVRQVTLLTKYKDQLCVDGVELFLLTKIATTSIWIPKTYRFSLVTKLRNAGLLNLTSSTINDEFLLEESNISLDLLFKALRGVGCESMTSTERYSVDTMLSSFNQTQDDIIVLKNEAHETKVTIEIGLLMENYDSDIFVFGSTIIDDQQETTQFKCLELETYELYGLTERGQINLKLAPNNTSDNDVGNVTDIKTHSLIEHVIRDSSSKMTEFPIIIKDAAVLRKKCLDIKSKINEDNSDKISKSITGKALVSVIVEGVDFVECVDTVCKMIHDLNSPMNSITCFPFPFEEYHQGIQKDVEGIQSLNWRTSRTSRLSAGEKKALITFANQHGIINSDSPILSLSTLPSSSLLNEDSDIEDDDQDLRQQSPNITQPNSALDSDVIKQPTQSPSPNSHVVKQPTQSPSPNRARTKGPPPIAILNSKEYIKRHLKAYVVTTSKLYTSRLKKLEQNLDRLSQKNPSRSEEYHEEYLQALAELKDPNLTGNVKAQMRSVGGVNAGTTSMFETLDLLVAFVRDDERVAAGEPWTNFYKPKED